MLMSKQLTISVQAPTCTQSPNCCTIHTCCCRHFITTMSCYTCMLPTVSMWQPIFRWSCNKSKKKEAGQKTETKEEKASPAPSLYVCVWVGVGFVGDFFLVVAAVQSQPVQSVQSVMFAIFIHWLPPLFSPTSPVHSCVSQSSTNRLEHSTCCTAAVQPIDIFGNTSLRPLERCPQIFLYYCNGTQYLYCNGTHEHFR